MMTIGSLFSGIGGLELGLEAAGLGPVLWQVEIDPYCRSVLAQHWPDARRYEDVREVQKVERVEIVCGGFPCQDLSSAHSSGVRTGLAGAKSGLWVEFYRILRSSRPRCVVVENVASGANGWVDHVRNDLEQLGYESLPIPLSGADVGAPHIRPRVFVVGFDPNRKGEPVVRKYAEVAELPTDKTALPGWGRPPSIRMADGISQRMAVYGNAVMPRAAQVIGEVIKGICS